MICPSTFWKQKCKNMKNVSLTFFFSSSNPFRPTLSLARGTNRQFYCTEVIICNKTKHFLVSVDRQTFLGFEMTSNSRDTSLCVLCVLLCGGSYGGEFPLCHYS